MEVVRQGPDMEAEKEDASKVSLSYPFFVHLTVLIQINGSSVLMHFQVVATSQGIALAVGRS